MGSLALFVMGSAFIGVFYGMLYIYAPIPVEGIVLICFFLILMLLAGVYWLFSRTACAKGKNDAKEMAIKYEEIKTKRRHLRNLNKTNQTIVSFK
jgi:uncharacterized membrane protein